MKRVPHDFRPMAEQVNESVSQYDHDEPVDDVSRKERHVVVGEHQYLDHADAVVSLQSYIDRLPENREVEVRRHYRLAVDQTLEHLVHDLEGLDRCIRVIQTD